MTRKQKIWGGIALGAILLLFMAKKAKAAPVLQEQVAVDEDGNVTEKSTLEGGAGGGFGGGFTPVAVAPSQPSTVVLPIQPIVTSAPAMSMGAPTSPVAVGSTSSTAAPTSTVTASKATPTASAAPMKPMPIAVSKASAPITAKFTSFLDFDGITQKSKMDMLL
jgi:hypothetical protein